MPGSEEHPCELGISEYDAAGFEFFGNAVRKLMEAQSPVYAQMPKEKREFVGSGGDRPQKDRAAHTTADATAARAFDIQYEVFFDVAEAIESRHDRLVATMDGAATEALRQLMPQIYKHISEICEITGNTVSGPLTYDKILDAFEQVHTTIDDHGNHGVSVVVSPDMYEKLLALGPMTKEQEERYKQIVLTKQKEQDVRRRSRSLPSFRN